VETHFAGRFYHVLKQLEHEARITVSTNGAVPFPHAGNAQKTTTSTLTVPGAPRVQNEPGGTPLRNAKERQDRQSLVAAQISKKLSDPVGNPMMTVEQVASVFSVSNSTIYRWIDTGRELGPERIKLTWVTHGKIPTESVRRALLKI
jgi:hypothetical protein